MTAVALPDAGAGLLANLDRARQALSEAATDFERLQVRDHTQALAAAAEILKRRDVQVAASLLVADAERAIHKASPPREAGRPKAGENRDTASRISGDVRRQIRSAHSNVDDGEYEAVKRQAVEQQEPLTRQALKDLGRAKRRSAQAAEREDARRKAAESAPAVDDRVRCCPVAELAQHVPQGSVDAVVTDPPYVAESLPVYRDLAAFAAHALRPGGLVLASAGQPYLPVILKHMKLGGGVDLKYRWCIAYYKPHAKQQVHSAKVSPRWLPVLVWTRAGSQPESYSTDWIDSGPYCAADKQRHHWGQSPGGLEALIREWVKQPSALICDPFCGAGSTLVAALRLGHRVIGSDIDPANVALTKEALVVPGQHERAPAGGPGPEFASHNLGKEGEAHG